MFDQISHVPDFGKSRANVDNANLFIFVVSSNWSASRIESYRTFYLFEQSVSAVQSSLALKENETFFRAVIRKKHLHVHILEVEYD